METTRTILPGAMTKSERARQLSDRLNACRNALDTADDVFAESDEETVAISFRELLYAAQKLYRYHHQVICGHDTYTISNAEYRARQLATFGPNVPDEAAIVERWVREQID